jgi:DNA-binding transcriptional ArsR family regulator
MADATRRAVVERLVRGQATVSELAQPHDITLPSFLKHLKVLEDAGIVRSEKSGRVRTCRLDDAALATAVDWLAEQRRLWAARTDRLQALAEALERPQS